jgi:hypothetical protein
MIFRRPELDTVMQAKGLKEPFEVVDLFEKAIADFCGSKYAVAVDNCTDALFLCLALRKYDFQERWSGYHADESIDVVKVIEIPKHTYISVPQTIISAGFKIKWTKEKWEKEYQLKPFNIYDAAVCFEKDMYIIKTSFYIFSLLMGLLAITSAGIISSESANLSKMSTMGLLLILSVIAFIFLYVFIKWSIYTFDQFKIKKESRWN